MLIMRFETGKIANLLKYMEFTLAQITDVHLGPIPFFGPRYWNIKRALGVLNWYRGRNRAHQPEVFQALAEDMADQKPDHIAVTGDLVNIGLPAEHIRALDWLRWLGGPDRVSIVPGNHDIYTKLGSDPGAMRWRDYMCSNGLTETPDRDGPGGFPYLRRFGDVALIGVNSAMPTKPFVAAGRLGSGQRRRLAELLLRTGKQGLVRVVMIHHPPLPGQAPKMRALQDAVSLAGILAQYGAELVLHGHNHQNMLQWLDGAVGRAVSPIPVIGTPSASMAIHHHGEPLARYNLFHLAMGTSGVEIDMVGRGFAEPGGRIVELERRRLVRD